MLNQMVVCLWLVCLSTQMHVCLCLNYGGPGVQNTAQHLRKHDIVVDKVVVHEMLKCCWNVIFSKMCFFWNVVVFCQMLFYFFKMLLCFLKCCIWRNVFSCNATVLCEMLLFLLSCVLTLKATVLNTCLCSSAPHLSAKQFVSVAVYMCRRLTCESDNIFTSFCSWHAERHVVISYGQKTEWLGCS